jgi:hypothetical protein
VGWREGLVGTATVGTNLRSQAGYALISPGPVVVENLRKENRFEEVEPGLDEAVLEDIAAGDPEHLEALRRTDPGSYICVLLRDRPKCYISGSGTRRPPSPLPRVRRRR